MQRVLQEQILFLEERVRTLRAQLTESLPVEQARDRLEAELDIEELALTHCRVAFEEEQMNVVDFVGTLEGD